jgi:murein DD-endopeptidase MepM/ murein hydrolase activator NlpD
MALLSAVLLLAPVFSFAGTPLSPSVSLSTYPSTVIQGEPIMISVEGGIAPVKPSTVRSIMFNGKSLGVFSYKGKPSALYGVDIRAKVGTSTVMAIFADGSSIQLGVYVGERKKVEEAFSIPEKLGGNTAAAVTTLVSTLARENASLLGLRTGLHAFWTRPFGYPVANPIVTDSYGYSRDTVGYSITHKGTDFRAVEGTPVLAMNRGVVRLVQEGRNYGKTVIIDHGLGLQTFYMHLSKINVKVGELVLSGQIIGLSGMTGYAEAAHLHTTVRIGEVSIDPVRFLGLFDI